MKLKLPSRMIDTILSVSEEAKNADMQLPTKVAGFGFALIPSGLLLIGAYFLNNVTVAMILAVCCFLIAPFAILSYKNQRIYVLSDEEFEYSTMLGRKIIYKFSDITALSQNKDSITLFVNGAKLHIDASAILSKRFVDLVNQALDNNENNKGVKL